MNREDRASFVQSRSNYESAIQPCPAALPATAVGLRWRGRNNRSRLL
jgi:hypothetical protein